MCYFFKFSVLCQIMYSSILDLSYFWDLQGVYNVHNESINSILYD